MTAPRPGAPAIAVERLTKRFGSTRAVDDLTFSVQAGRITGFLGPNGAGKTTTLRVLLGLARPTGGSASIFGVPYAHLDRPARTVGAVLEATSFHPTRRAIDHLRACAVAGRIPVARAEAVLAAVGLSEVARVRVGRFSLGMRQRLQLATAMLGDPSVLVLDEPLNGLDPQGIQWMRSFMRYEAAQGRAILVSSHLLTEIQETVDDVVIVSKGRLVAQMPLDQIAARDGAGAMVARTPEPARLLEVLGHAGLTAALESESDGVGTVVVAGTTPEQLGPILAGDRIVLYGLDQRRTNLEDLFLSLTSGYDAVVPPGEGGPA